MASRLTHAAALALGRAPALKRIPVMRLLAMAEFTVLTRQHIADRLTPDERRRVLALVRKGRGRPSQLSHADRDELRSLIAKAEPRLLAGEAVEAISPVPLPRRLVYGRRHA